MKLSDFIVPTLSAVIKVVSLMFTIVSLSYGGIVYIAKSEAKTIEGKIMAVRSADMEHLNKRFDDTHAILKEIRSDIKDIKKNN